MRTQKSNQHTLAIELSYYVHPWPNHKTRIPPITNSVDPLPASPNYPAKHSAKALGEYHLAVKELANRRPGAFDDKRAQLESERLKTTLSWVCSLPSQKEKKKALDVIFNQVARRPGYSSGSRIADCFGLTYLHWKVLCEKTSIETITNPTYWKPILDRCLHFRSNWLGTIKFDFTDDDETAERDLQDLLFWAYQEQQRARATNDNIRLQKADQLLKDIYQTVQTALHTVLHTSPYQLEGLGHVGDRHKRTLLYWAILCHQTDAIETLWKDPQNHWMLHQRTCYGYDFTPLDLAVHMSDLEMVQRLIKMGANPNNQNVQGDSSFQHREHITPLHRAVRMGRLDLVQVLVENGANIDQKAFDRTPLYWAINMHQWEMAEYLLQKGANPEGGMEGSLWKKRPLHMAIEAVPAVIDFDWENKEQYPAYRVTKSLLEKGAYYNQPMRYCPPDSNPYELEFTEASRCKSISLLHELINTYNINPSNLDEHVYYTKSKNSHSRFNADNPQMDMTAEHLSDRAAIIHVYRNLHRGVAAFRDQQWGDTKYYLQTAAEKSNLFMEFFFIPLLAHYTHPERNILSSPNRIRLVKSLNPKEAIPLVQLMITIPEVRRATLSSEDPRYASTVLSIAKSLKISLELQEERKLLNFVISKAQTSTLKNLSVEERKILIGRHNSRLQEVSPSNDINREMMDLVYYFKNWRLKNASNSVVRFFKEKKTNKQREEQLSFLESMRRIESDEIKLGALITLSQEIDQEWNVFNSELKKQVDVIIEGHLEDIEPSLAAFTRDGITPSTTKKETAKQAPLSKKKQKALKEKCLKAYQDYQVQQQTQAAKTSKAYDF